MHFLPPRRVAHVDICCESNLIWTADRPVADGRNVIWGGGLGRAHNSRNKINRPQQKNTEDSCAGISDMVGDPIPVTRGEEKRNTNSGHALILSGPPAAGSEIIWKLTRMQRGVSRALLMSPHYICKPTPISAVNVGVGRANSKLHQRDISGDFHTDDCKTGCMRWQQNTLHTAPRLFGMQGGVSRVILMSPYYICMPTPISAVNVRFTYGRL